MNVSLCHVTFLSVLADLRYRDVSRHRDLNSDCQVLNGIRIGRRDLKGDAYVVFASVVSLWWLGSEVVV
ncbi:hypothetical protein Taro_028033 [Colocasia esculenta]|uniref:Uncharacterized protein n=1 Tax=Colocasia esculenta TaxID=4460 RepID=A0A843VHE4_COLES|nr:hypothetical protein [Colocasia esculenta]